MLQLAIACSTLSAGPQPLSFMVVAARKSMICPMRQCIVACRCRLAPRRRRRRRRCWPCSSGPRQRCADPTEKGCACMHVAAGCCAGALPVYSPQSAGATRRRRRGSVRPSGRASPALPFELRCSALAPVKPARLLCSRKPSGLGAAEPRQRAGALGQSRQGLVLGAARDLHT